MSSVSLINGNIDREENNPQREKLIELLKKTRCEKDCDGFKNIGTCKACTAYERYAESADYLLLNGVVAPPCKVGQTVYVIFEKKIYEAIVEQMTVSSLLSGNKIIRIRAEFEIEDWFYNDGRKTKYGVYRDYKDGVYITKEEAEQALKGGAE